MDINQWLQRTVTARDEDALELQEEEAPTRIRPRSTNHETQRALSPAPPRIAEVRTGKAKQRTRIHKRKASSSAYSKSSGSASTNSDSGLECPSSSSSSAPSENFERRKRHKTRENLYEPHSGALKRRSKQKDKDEVKEGKRKKKHRRTEKKRKDAKKPGQNLINNFSADRVHHDRLTLQPGASIGLFKKGRASSPTKQRGLPDLVFSEMRFLQKPRQQPDTSLQQDSGKERKKRNKRQDIENAEISAFFSERRPPLAREDENRESTANTVVTHSLKPRSHTGLVLSIGNPKSDNRDRHHSEAHSYSARPVVPEDSITNVGLNLLRVFSGSKVMLAGQYEQSSAYSPRQSKLIEMSEPVEISSRIQQQDFRHDRQIEATKTVGVTANPAQYDECNQDRNLIFEARHPGDNNTEQNMSTSRSPLAKRPLSSSMTMLLRACDKAMEQQRKPRPDDGRDAQYPAAVFEQLQSDTRRGVLPNTTQSMGQMSSTIVPNTQYSYPENVDRVTKEHTYLVPQSDIGPLQHNFPAHIYATQEYDPGRHMYNEHEQQHGYTQQQALPRAHADQYCSQFEPENTMSLQTRMEDIHQPIEQQSYALVNHAQDQVLPQSNEPYYQNQAHSQDRYHNPNNIQDIQNKDYPGGDYMILPNNAYRDSAGAGVLGHMVGGTEQHFVANGIGYEHYRYPQHDEGTGIEEELDYELYGQVSQPEMVMDQDECESSVLPSSFWRPRHRY